LFISIRSGAPVCQFFADRVPPVAARTTGAAYRLMAEGKVLAGDHVIGRERAEHEGEVGWLPSPRVEARHRDHLRVAP
jgi:MOSC domain-containing protein YiiM